MQWDEPLVLAVFPSLYISTEEFAVDVVFNVPQNRNTRVTEKCNTAGLLLIIISFNQFNFVSMAT